VPVASPDLRKLSNSGARGRRRTNPPDLSTQARRVLGAPPVGLEPTTLRCQTLNCRLIVGTPCRVVPTRASLCAQVARRDVRQGEHASRHPPGAGACRPKGRPHRLPALRAAPLEACGQPRRRGVAHGFVQPSDRQAISAGLRGGARPRGSQGPTQRSAEDPRPLTRAEACASPSVVKDATRERTPSATGHQRAVPVRQTRRSSLGRRAAIRPHRTRVFPRVSTPNRPDVPAGEGVSIGSVAP
jgi:hypothetical protein